MSKKNGGSNLTYSRMLTGFLDLFGLFLTVCDSFFFSVRNEPRIFFQKSVIFVCKGRATYWNGIKILDGLCIQSNRSSQPMSHRFWVHQMTSHKRQFENLPRNLCFVMILDLEFVSPTFVSPDRWCSQYRNLWKHQLPKASHIHRHWQNSDLIPRLLEIFEILKNF